MNNRVLAVFGVVICVALAIAILVAARAAGAAAQRTRDADVRYADADARRACADLYRMALTRSDSLAVAIAGPPVASRNVRTCLAVLTEEAR